MDFLQELKWRGLVKDCTDFEGLQEKLKGTVTAYCGFDPTAEIGRASCRERVSSPV